MHAHGFIHAYMYSDTVSSLVVYKSWDCKRALFGFVWLDVQVQFSRPTFISMSWKTDQQIKW